MSIVLVDTLDALRVSRHGENGSSTTLTFEGKPPTIVIIGADDDVTAILSKFKTVAVPEFVTAESPALPEPPASKKRART